MDIRIKTAHIQNFRSVADATLEFTPGINILAGPNGSGKSNILRALSRLSKNYRGNENDQSRFSKDGVSIAVQTLSGEVINILQNDFKQDYAGSVFMMEALRGYPDRSYVPRSPISLKPDGSNLAGMLNFYRGSMATAPELEKLTKRVKQITPEISDILSEFKGDDTAELHVKIKKNGDTYTFTPETMATGSLDVIFLVLAIQLFREGSIFLLDGPDSHLHAGSQKSMIDLLREIAAKDSKQFIIATHSSYLVDSCSNDEIFLVSKKGFKTSVESISEKKEIIEVLEGTDTQLSDITSSMKKV